jgi:hypothetical protein
MDFLGFPWADAHGYMLPPLARLITVGEARDVVIDPHYFPAN